MLEVKCGSLIAVILMGGDLLHKIEGGKTGGERCRPRYHETALGNLNATRQNLET
jgi:hypothetical protein